jgi:hypothetical protein
MKSVTEDGYRFMGHSIVEGPPVTIPARRTEILRNAAVTPVNLVQGPIRGRGQGKSGNTNDQNYDFIP